MPGPTPNPKKRGFTLPHGCKDLGAASKAKPFPKVKAPGLKVRANLGIRAEKVDVRNEDGMRVGVLARSDALKRALSVQKDLVEIDAGATPPVCLLIDY